MQVKPLFLALAVAVSGCAPTRILSLHQLTKYSTARFTWPAEKVVSNRHDVVVRDLTELLARASWVDRRFEDRPGFWLRYPNGRELYLSRDFCSFRERDVPGSFEVLPEDCSAFRDEVAKVMAKADPIVM